MKQGDQSRQVCALWMRFFLHKNQGIFPVTDCLHQNQQAIKARIAYPASHSLASRKYFFAYTQDNFQAVRLFFLVRAC